MWASKQLPSPAETRGFTFGVTRVTVGPPSSKMFLARASSTQGPDGKNAGFKGALAILVVVGTAPAEPGTTGTQEHRESFGRPLRRQLCLATVSPIKIFLGDLFDSSEQGSSQGAAWPVLLSSWTPVSSRALLQQALSASIFPAGGTPREDPGHSGLPVLPGLGILTADDVPNPVAVTSLSCVATALMRLRAHRRPGPGEDAPRSFCWWRSR